LVYGDSGADVMILQQKLKTAGFYSGSISGSYDASTVIAVRKYQTSKGIKLTGNVGPLTLESLNK
jgi:peptidoglycan hydrolase-like protein with peptidoglycan-binding domain